MPLMTPLAAQVVHQGYGVNQHVNFQTNIHQHQAEIMERYGAMRIYQMRSKYVPTLSNFDTALAAARTHGVKWNATVADKDTTKATIESRIAHIAANAADVVHWIEGINEPNEGTTWVAPTVDRQQWIWDAVHSHPELAHVTVLGPSMHDVRLDNSNGQHWLDFVNGGGAAYMEMCAVHCYPGASLPDTKRAERVQWVYDAFGAGYPIKFTEWGYTNTLGLPKSNRTGGHKCISQVQSAIYDCQAVFDFANNDFQLLRYEMMDDPDGTGETDAYATESNFGLWEVQTVGGDPDTTWTAKNVVSPLTDVLSWLEDPGDSYTPTPVELTISAHSSVRTCLTQKRDGSTRLWLWRHGEIWDPIAEEPITLASVEANVTDATGSHAISVGPEVTYLDITTSTPTEGPSITLLTSGTDTNNSTSRTTASITPGGDWTLLAVASYDNTSTDISSVTGCGLTWTPLTEKVPVFNYAIQLFQGTGTPTTGSLTINYATSVANSAWAICQLDNAGLASASGFNSDTSVNALTASLASPPASDSLSVGAFLVNNDSNVTEGTGYTALVEQKGSGPTLTLMVEHDLGAQSAGVTWVTAGGAAGFILSVPLATTTPTGSATGGFHFTGEGAGTPSGTAEGGNDWTGTAFGTAVVKGSATGTFTITASASGTNPEIITGSVVGTFTFTATTSGSAPSPDLTLYTPPVHEEGIRTVSPILRYFRLTWALSVVKVNGVWTAVRSPSHELLAGLTHGVDYFRGGYIYALPADVYADVNAAFPSGPTEESDRQVVATVAGQTVNLIDDNDNLITV